MISYPSSFESSRISDKQNINPNINKIKTTGFSQYNKQKAAIFQSGRSQQFIYAYNSMEDINKIEASQNSMKTIMRQFCSTIQETQENADIQNFKHLAIKYFNRGQLSRKQLIQLCKRNQIYTVESLKLIIQGVQIQQAKKKYTNLKNLLSTNLGELMVEQLCDCLQKGKSITKQQERIIELLIPNNFQQQITVQSILQYYQIFKQQRAAQSAQLSNLALEFCNIHKNKIQSRLSSDHFRLQISKSLNYRQEKTRLGFHSLCKCIGDILTLSEISIVFRHIYALQTNLLMPILDTSRTICLKLLQANLLRQDNSQITKVNLQQKNVHFYLQQHHKELQKYKKQQNINFQQLSKKDKQIQQLKRIIDMMQIQKQQQQKIKNKQIQVQTQACRIKYQKRIEQLLQSNKQQVKLTQWYQRELQVMMDSVNKENVMRKYLGNKFQS